MRVIKTTVALETLPGQLFLQKSVSRFGQQMALHLTQRRATAS